MIDEASQPNQRNKIICMLKNKVKKKVTQVALLKHIQKCHQEDAGCNLFSVKFSICGK